VWTNAAGEVRSATGVRLPSAKLGATDTVWVDRESAILGVFTAGGGSTKPIGDQLSTTMGYGQREDGKDWNWRSVSLFPAGARSISFGWANADSHSKVSTTTLPEGAGVVAMADATASGTSQGPIVTSVTWTDAAGTRHTEMTD